MLWEFIKFTDKRSAIGGGCLRVRDEAGVRKIEPKKH